MNRLQQLLAVVAVVTVGGVGSYTLYQAQPGVQNADMADAGFRFADHPLFGVTAAVVYEPDLECMALPDGGTRKSRYANRNLWIRPMTVDGGGPDQAGGYVDWQPQKLDGGPCISLIEPNAMRLNPSLATPEQDGWCACKVRGQTCNVDRYNAAGQQVFLADGGPSRVAAPVGTSLAERLNPAGPGCVRIPCIEQLGGAGSVWAPECGSQNPNDP